MRVFLLAASLLLAGCVLPEGPRASIVTYPGEVLGGAPWTELVVEIDHAPGHAPSEAAKAHLVSTLRNVTSKTTVTLLVEESLPNQAKALTGEDLLAMERDFRTTAHQAPVALLHVLYPAGTYADNANATGLTIGGVALGPASVFLDTIREFEPAFETDVGVIGLPVPLPYPEGAVDVIERATLLHEVGHAFGLVNNGIEMVSDHEDADHPVHSRNEASVMFWRVDSYDGIREMLLRDGAIADAFDRDDLADIRSVGGR